MTTPNDQPAGAPPGGSTHPATRRAWWHPRVIRAIAQRDFLRFFFNPTGYLFIALFVIACAVLAYWQPVFFTRNLANLDTLSGMMPYLLLFFIPAVTMNVWADERRQGTDELLLTLPATDLDVVLGKFLAAVGIYTVSLIFTLPLVFLLAYLGEPDYGLVFSTYLGYWLMGVMMLALGMLASQLTSNVTVAFILGAGFAAIPVFAGLLGSPTGATLRRQIENLSVSSQVHDFGTGVISFSGIFYFLSTTAAILYLNRLLLGRRHWAGGERSPNHWLHSTIRAAALIVAIASLNVLVGRTGARADMSEEGLHTLSKESIELIKQIPSDRPVYIQAYFSPEVPRDYVQTRADLIALLKEYAARGGDRIRLNLVETDLYSPEARDAEKRFGIEPRRVMVDEESRQSFQEILLGVAFTSGLEEVVIPFFDRGLPVEYELTRSIRVVSRSSRKRVGILNTDARLMGGFDMRTMGQNPEWSIVTELKKQYDVSSVAPDVDIPSDLDVLLVAQPSSLTQKQIDNLTAFVKKGGPTLLFLDPLPVENPQISPEVPRQPPGGPMGGGPPPEPKGDLKPLLDLLGLEWPTTDIVWNPYNPLQQRPDLPPEVVFIGRGSGADDAFNKDDIVTSGLQEVVAIFPGLLRPRSGAGPEFTPLLRTSTSGGTLQWSEATRQGFMGMSGLNPNRRHFPTGEAYTLAAHLKGDAPKDASSPAPDSKADAEKKEAKPSETKPARIHAIAIADLDLISEEFFELRRQKVQNLELDNITFVLNCVDVLAGDDAFVALRKRRIRHRTLLRLERETKQFVDQYQRETKAAEDAAKLRLDEAQRNLDKEVDAVRARKDVDERTKEILLLNLQEVANRRLDVQKANIDDEKRRTILESKADSEQAIRSIQNRVRSLALILPPIPPLLLGLLLFGRRIQRENLGANPNRLV
ncbi:MAG: Gldg family protein [Isosphaeraceae bacterium]